MKCGPEVCPLTAWSALSPSERKVQRQPLARKLHEQGFTPEEIAGQFGVSLATIYRDLEFSHDEKTQPSTSKRGRKGEGRPKGSKQGPKPEQRKTTADQDTQIAGAILDAGRTYEQAQQEFDVSNTVVRRAVHQALEHVEIKRRLTR